MGVAGIAIGIPLILVVIFTAVALGRKANAGVEAFREEHHESFLGRSAE
jgi:hypothetical protein